MSRTGQPGCWSRSICPEKGLYRGVFRARTDDLVAAHTLVYLSAAGPEIGLKKGVFVVGIILCAAIMDKNGSSHRGNKKYDAVNCGEIQEPVEPLDY